MKRPPRQVRLDEDVEAEIKKIAEVTSLSHIEIIRQTIKAGVLAIKENGYRLPLPLHLNVAEEAPKNLSKSNLRSGSADAGATASESPLKKSKAA